jgi:hypothetical protein
MADLSINISNSFRAQSPGRTNLWGVLVWGVDFWGDSKDVAVDVGKWLSNYISATDTIGLGIYRSFTNTFSIGSSMNLVSLTDGAGYTYILQGGVSDPDNRLFPSYTSGSRTAPVYTDNSPNNPTWTQA